MFVNVPLSPLSLLVSLNLYMLNSQSLGFFLFFIEEHQASPSKYLTQWTDYFELKLQFPSPWTEVSKPMTKVT